MEFPAHKIETDVNGNVARVYTLKSSCLNTVIKHFDQLMLQYESGKVPKKPFKHLQITQSSTLLREFVNKERYKKYVKFLLPSMETIDLTDCEWNMDVVMIHLQTIANTIIKLSLSGYINQDHLMLLCSQMVKLKSLSLHFATLTNLVFQTIGKFCTSLETLQVSACYGVTDKNLQALCPVTKNRDNSVKIRCKNNALKSIDVSQTNVTSVGVAFILEHFPNMEYITHDDVFNALYSMHGESFESGNFHNLKQYNLKKMVLSTKDLYHENALKICSALCPHVCEISLEYVPFQSQLNTLSEFTALTQVHIASEPDFDMPPFDLTPFVEIVGKNLITMSLVKYIVSTPTLCRCCPKLTTLKLESMHLVTMEEFENMPPMHYFQHLEVLHVKHMDFSLISVSESIRCILSSSPNLEQLTILSADGISLAFVDSLTTCAENLQELNIINTIIESPAAMKFLLICPNIKKYNLHGTSIQFQDYRAMKTSKPFVEIDTDYFVSGENSHINIHTRHISDLWPLGMESEFDDINESESDEDEDY